MDDPQGDEQQHASERGLRHMLQKRRPEYQQHEDDGDGDKARQLRPPAGLRNDGGARRTCIHRKRAK